MLSLRRLIQKSGFWFTLILCSYLINIFLVFITIHNSMDTITTTTTPITITGLVEGGGGGGSLRGGSGGSGTSSGSGFINDYFFFFPTHNNKRPVVIVDPPIHENIVWHRMLQEQNNTNNNNEKIMNSNSNSKNSNSNSNNISSSSSSSLRPSYCRHNYNNNKNFNNGSTTTSLKQQQQLQLPQPEIYPIKDFGFHRKFRHDVKWFLQQQQQQKQKQLKPTTTTGGSSSNNIDTDTDTDTNSNTCYLPPSSACENKKYSVVIYSHGIDFRQLFLNIMSFKAYPSVSDITLILPFDITSRTQLKQQITKYNNNINIIHIPYIDRIVDWIITKSITLHAVSSSSSSFWSVLTQQKDDGMLHKSIRTDTILFINGDIPKKDWTGPMLKQKFQVWKNNPRVLLAANNNNNKNNNHNNPSSSSLSTSTKTIIKTNNHVPSSSCRYPQFHQLMIHKNYLCYLDHPIMDNIRRYHDQQQQQQQQPSSSNNKFTTTTTTTTTKGVDSWKKTQNIISMIWNHVANGHTLFVSSTDGDDTSTTSTTTTTTNINTIPEKKKKHDATTTITNSIDDDDDNMLILDYFECECVWPMTTEIISADWSSSSNNNNNICNF